MFLYIKLEYLYSLTMEKIIGSWIFWWRQGNNYYFTVKKSVSPWAIFANRHQIHFTMPPDKIYGKMQWKHLEKIKNGSFFYSKRSGYKKSCLFHDQSDKGANMQCTTKGTISMISNTETIKSLIFDLLMSFLISCG